MSNAMNADPLIAAVRFDADGLVPVIAQEVTMGRVLMLAYMNAEALRATLRTGQMTYWSRSRQKLWRKGETSGHVQAVRGVRLDCDGDALLFAVEQAGGAACHTGHRTCFFRAYEGGALADRGRQVFDPEDVYG